MAPYVNGSVSHGNPPVRGSRLSQWLERANARPSVAACNAEIAAMPQAMTSVADLLEQGLFKREYRDHRLEWMIRSGGLEVVVRGLEKQNIRFTPDLS